MRTFLALPCPLAVHEALAGLRDELGARMSLRPVPCENFHLTVRFLGEVSASRVEDLDARLQRGLPTPGPLSIALEGVGAFPDPSRPGAVWAGVRPTDELRGFYGSVETLAVEVGFAPRKHDFHPHVTLGRVRGEPDDTTALVEWIQAHGAESFGGFEADHLHLVESVREGEGPPSYHCLMRWPL